MEQKLYEVDDNKADELIKTGNFNYDNEVKSNETLVGEVKSNEPQVVDRPDTSWTEKRIYQWIQNNNLDIDYNIKRDTKNDVLKKIAELLWT